MQKTALFGGTFNPVHHAHLQIAEKAMSEFHLDRIIFLPSGRPPHKQQNAIVPPEHRYRMVEAAIAGKSGFEVSDYEIKRDTLSYTADTVKEFSAQYLGEKLYFLIGGDSLMQFEHWYHPEIICRYVTILACGRNGYHREEILQKMDVYRELFHAEIQYFEIPEMMVSSHEIRERIMKRLPVSDMMPTVVEDYIIKHHLYIP